jgi:hypothetical protein
MGRKGVSVRLTPGRRLVCDVIEIARRQPMAAFYRDLDIGALEALRKKIRPRLSWNAIMMKAYAIVSREVPELRQYYVRFPWPYLYQSHKTVALITLARSDEMMETAGPGDTGGLSADPRNATSSFPQRLRFARFHSPEEHSLRQIQDKLDHFQDAPLDQIAQFRHQDRFARLPGLVRRLLWWLLTDAVPSQRATYIGTFGMSLSGFNQTFGNCHLGPNTTILGVDPTPRDGQARVLLTFDHRVLDGKPVIDIISKLYSVLRGPILTELQAISAENSAGKSTAGVASHPTSSGPNVATSEPCTPHIEASTRPAGTSARAIPTPHGHFSDAATSVGHDQP